MKLFKGSSKNKEQHAAAAAAAATPQATTPTTSNNAQTLSNNNGANANGGANASGGGGGGLVASAGGTLSRAKKEADEKPRIGIISISDLVIGERMKGNDNSTFSGKWNGVAVAIKMCERSRVAPLLNNVAKFFNLTRHENVARFCGLCLDYYGAVYQRPSGAQALAPKLADLSAANRRALSGDVARALQHLHGNEIVHGGLSVRCIELRPMDLPGGVTFGACVGDWGMGDVKLLAAEDDECKWQSLEQLCDGEVSKAADIWTLGCVIRCALYGGAPPWQGFAVAEAIELMRSGATPRAAKLDGVEVPAPILSAAQGCWIHDADARLSADAIVELLDGAGDGAAKQLEVPLVPTASSAATAAAAAAAATTSAAAAAPPSVAAGAAAGGETFTPAPAKDNVSMARVVVGGEVFTPAPRRDEGPTPWLGKEWHYADITRAQAEELLKTAPAGSFVVRSSSQPGAHALTFIQDDGVIGHGLLYKENGTWSVEKKPPFHATLEALLRAHTGLKYDEAQQRALKATYVEQRQRAQYAPPPVSADGAPPASDGIVVCSRCEAIPAEVDCTQCAMLFCRGCSADLHGKGLFRMHALKPHANSLTPGTAVVPRQRPSENDYVGKPWYRPDWDRVGAETVLSALPSGAFGLRPSSQPNRLALSHSKGPGNGVGHAIIHVHNGENNRYGYSIEDRDVNYPTLEQLLSSLVDLRFDLVLPPPAAPSVASVPRAASPPPAKPNGAAGGDNSKRASASVMTGSTEFSPFLPRAVRKDEAGRFEAPKYTALGVSQQQQTVAGSVAANSKQVDDELRALPVAPAVRASTVPPPTLPPLPTAAAVPAADESSPRGHDYLGGDDDNDNDDDDMELTEIVGDGYEPVGSPGTELEFAL